VIAAVAFPMFWRYRVTRRGEPVDPA